MLTNYFGRWKENSMYLGDLGIFLNHDMGQLLMDSTRVLQTSDQQHETTMCRVYSRQGWIHTLLNECFLGLQRKIRVGLGKHTYSSCSSILLLLLLLLLLVVVVLVVVAAVLIVLIVVTIVVVV